MSVLLVADGFGRRSATVLAAAAAGWRDTAPGAVVATLLLGDGGPGWLDAVAAGAGVAAPDGADPLVLPGAVHVEAARLVADAPGASSEPLGHAVAAGLRVATRDGADARPRDLVVALGGPGPHDGGAGLLRALAAELLGTPPAADPLPHLRALHDAWTSARGGVPTRVATDVGTPLLGLGGASAALAAAGDVDRDRAQALEQDMSRWAHDAVVALGDRARPDLLATPGATGAPTAGRWARTPGAGAFGGAGFALALLGATLVPGPRLAAELLDLAGAVDAADLVVVVTPELGHHDLHGTVLAEAAHRGAEAGVPVVVLAGAVLVGRREQQAAGVAGAYVPDPVPGRPGPGGSGPGPGAEAVRALAARVARTWSRA